jgi:hypothetical protein
MLNLRSCPGMLAGLALAAALAPLTAQAGGEEGSACADTDFGNQKASMACMSRLDRDGDGNVSHAEARAEPLIAVHFSQLDRNGDGKLSQSEFARLGASPPAKAGALGY